MTQTPDIRQRIAERSASRSAEQRRARAASAVDRILDAATTLAEEQGGSFTVQQAADAAGVALQTLYRHFKSKDELVLAIFEEANLEATGTIRRQADAVSDPLEKLKIIMTKAAIPDPDIPRLNAEIIVREHLRLYEQFPREVETSLLPFRALIADAIAAAQDAGAFSGIDPDTEAEIIHHLIISRFHLQTLGLLDERRESAAEDLWQFCLGALCRHRSIPQDARPRSLRKTIKDVNGESGVATS